MAISTYSYCNKLRICVTSDSKLFENQAQLKLFIRDIEDGLHDLAKYYNIDQNCDEMTMDSSKNQYTQFNDKLIRRLSAARFKANG